MVDIWIEAEQWSSDFNIYDENTDVRVTLEDDSEWIATFFTYKNILNLRDKNKNTGECLSGKYFWASNMFLIDEISRENILNVVSELLANGQFTSAFTLNT
jgi:hypothetical protein